MAKVTIEFNNDIQANALAILAEEGKLGKLIRDYLNSSSLSEEVLGNEYAYVEYDESDFNKHHTVTF
ncbi:MAG: hypothetical protein JKX82_04920 [Oleispira sp.]|nr:hypothetical protein [Oleispira sp.]